MLFDKKNITQNVPKVLFFLLIGFFCFLFLFENTKEEPDYNEIIPLQLSHVNSITLLKTVAAGGIETSPPLYHLIIKFLSFISNSSVFFLRLTSGIWSLLLILCIWFFTREMWDQRTALMTAVLMVFNPGLLIVSREIRFFSLSALIFLAIAVSFYYLILHRYNFYALIYGLFLLIGLYTNYFILLAIPASIPVLIYYYLHEKDPGNKRMLLVKYFTVHGITLLLYLPWLAGFMRQLSVLSRHEWAEPFSKEVLINLFAFFYTYKFGYELNPLVPAAFIGLFALIILFFNIYKEVRLQNHTAHYIFLLSYLLIPCGIILIFSLFFFSIINYRYIIILFPVFCLLSARSFMAINNQYLRYVLFALLVLLPLPTLFFIVTPSQNNQPAKLAAQYFSANYTMQSPIIAQDNISYFSIVDNLPQKQNFYLFDAVRSKELTGLIGHQSLDTYSLAALLAGQKDCWLIRKPAPSKQETQLNFFPDNFKVDNQVPPVYYSGSFSWVQFEILHLINTSDDFLNVKE